MFVKYFPEAAFPLFALAPWRKTHVITCMGKTFLNTAALCVLVFWKTCPVHINDTNKHISTLYRSIWPRCPARRDRTARCERDGGIRVVSVLFDQIINIFLSTHHVYLFIINWRHLFIRDDRIRNIGRLYFFTYQWCTNKIHIRSFSRPVIVFQQ